MGFDDLDDLLHGDDELEAAFRELDAKIKLDELRREGATRQTRRGTRKPQSATKSKRTASKSTDDPLADLKAAFDGKKKPSPAKKRKAAPKAASKPKGPVRRYLVVVCPNCGGKNRVPLERLRKSLPVCGRCKTDLSFERS